MSRLNDEEFLSQVQKLNGTPQEIINDATFQSFFLPILRQDFSLLDNYFPHSEESSRFPVLLFRGLEDEHVSLEEMQSWGKISELIEPVYEMPGDRFCFDNRIKCLKSFPNTYLRRCFALKDSENALFSRSNNTRPFGQLV